MKNVFYFFLVLIIAVGLMACSLQKNVEDLEKDQTIATPKDDKSAIDEASKREPPTVEPENEEPSTNPDKPTTEPKIYQNEAFKEVVVTESSDQFVVTGKAQVFEGVFQYKLFANNKVILEDSYQTNGAPSWGDFNITFRKNFSENVTVLKLFVYSAKDGSEINVLEVPVEK